MYLPSIDLLRLVLEIEEGVVSYSRNDIDDEVSYSVSLYLNTDDEVIENYSINIHTLVYNFKEWAYKQKFTIVAGRYSLEDTDYICTIEQALNRRNFWSSNSESEAVFNACEYILDLKLRV